VKVMVGFPRVQTDEQFRALPRSDPGILEAATALWRRLGLAPGNLSLFETGSLPVFAAGHAHVLKLFPPCFAEEEPRERSVLERLAGALPVPTPGVAASGEVEGWRYLVMDRLRGDPLDGLWRSLTSPHRVDLAEQTGALLAALHALDPQDAAALRPDWPCFVREQSERCVERQRGLGAAESWLEQIPPFLEVASVSLEARRVLLHTEIMRAHLLAERGAEGWKLSGLLDFEPAMIGAAEYEFASVGLYVTRCDAAALGALLRAYGYREQELGLPLQRRFLAYALLHRYSNLRRYLQEDPPPPGIETLDALAATWWALPAR
jgi:hygromycin-B 7''-O-kinase